MTRDESSFKNPILVDIGGIKDKNNNEIVRNYNGVIAGEFSLIYDGPSKGVSLNEHIMGDIFH